MFFFFSVLTVPLCLQIHAIKRHKKLMNTKWFSLSWAALGNHSYIFGVIQLNFGLLAGPRSQQPVANFYYRALRWIRPESQQRKAVHRFYATLPLPGNCPSPALFERGAVYTPALCLATTHTHTHTPAQVRPLFNPVSKIKQDNPHY